MIANCSDLCFIDNQETILIFENENIMFKVIYAISYFLFYRLFVILYANNSLVRLSVTNNLLQNFREGVGTTFSFD